MAKVAKKKDKKKKAATKTAGKRAASRRPAKRAVKKAVKKVSRKKVGKGAPKKKAAVRKKVAVVAKRKAAPRPAMKETVPAPPPKSGITFRRVKSLGPVGPKLPFAQPAPARIASSPKADLTLPVAMPLDVPLRPDDMRSSPYFPGESKVESD